MPGIEAADEQREDQADKALTQEPQPQGQEEGAGPLEGGLFLPAQQKVEGGHQTQGDKVVGENLQVQGKKTDAGEEDEAPQPGRAPPQEAPADEVGEPDLAQGRGQEWAGGPPGRRPRKFYRPAG